MTLILLHSICTFILFGLILVIQIVHYPIFNFVNISKSKEAFKFHQQRIAFIVAPLMIFELFSGIYLAYSMWDGFRYIQILNLVLISTIWIHTFFIMVPIHNHLEKSFSKELVLKLVKQNWIRTFAWTIKSFLWALILWHIVSIYYT